MTDLTTKDALQTATDMKEFKPTPYHEKWLDSAVETMSEEITEIAAHCGIDRASWYRWLKIPGFIDWYKAEWDRRIKGFGPKLDMIGMKNAKRDHKFWQDMQRRVGNIKDAPGTTVPIQNNFNFDLDRYLK